ncbi:Gfo/Idh/MocA family protein [Tropicimonas marinistellae]|uniref:Gfo/Idh/MocA family protein n=1 Tax=Tropicimonas marinistellae TaxID=1739787 RepID=UPI00082EA004|nr:Gfo/Idh/MocA family oxidoreductase [Tropicimonas marinistellae]
MVDGRDVRLAIAGVGLVGKRHADAMFKTDGVRLVGVADPSDEGRQYAQVQDTRHYETLAELLEGELPDGVILATPTPLHVEQALACVEAGVPALIEKPLADSADAGDALVRRAAERRIPLLVGHHRRYNPLIQRARAVIESGEIGEVRAVQASCWFYKPDGYFDVAPWRKRRGAGPISVNLVHDIDLMRHLCGEILSVQAQASPSLRGYENEDVAAALFRFEGGAIGTISVSDSVVAPWSWEMTSQENPIYPATSESCYLIGGSQGSLSLPDLRMWTHRGARDWWQPISATSLLRNASDPLINQIAHFAEVIRGRAKPLVSGLEGLRTLRVVEAIQRSAETGRWTDVGTSQSRED